MAELNQNLYQASYEVLKNGDVPEFLADAASRIVATDEAGKPNLGRLDVDQDICKSAMQHYANSSMERYNSDRSPNLYDLEPEERD